MRYLLLLMILVGFPIRFAAADVYIYTDASPNIHNQGLADPHNIILSAEYTIWEDDFSFIFTNADGFYGFYDKASGCLHPAVFDMVDDYYSTDPYAPVLVEKNGYIGYVYRDRCEYAILPIYQSYHDFSCFKDGYAIVGKKPGSLPYGCEYVLIDREGREISFPDGFEPYYLPREGYVTIIDPSTGLLGIATVTGDVVVLPVYNGFGSIGEGYVSYKSGSKWGHMDLLGDFCLPPTFELYYDCEDPTAQWGYTFQEGVATLLLATDDGGYLVQKIDFEGNFLP